MPYVNATLSNLVQKDIDSLVTTIREQDYESRPGLLNHVVSRIVAESLEEVSLRDPNVYSWPYRNIADAVSVFTCAALEFYRRIAVPKEEAAIKKNGDLMVYRSQREAI